MSIEDDLKAVLGDNATDETVSALSQLIKKATDDEVSGLKAKVDDLLKESKSAKAKAEEASKAKAAAELEAMKRSGDIQAIEERLRKEQEDKMRELQAVIESKDQMILGGAKNSAIAKLAGLATSEETGIVLTKLAESMIDAKYDDQGGISVTYRDLSGQAIGTDSSKFIEHIKTSGAFAPLIKSSAGTGSGSTGGGSVLAGKKPSDYSTAELSVLRKDNPDLYKQVIQSRTDEYNKKISGGF